MQLDIAKLKAVVAKKGYKWFDNLNIIGIRTTLQVPDVFNDVLCVVWKQAVMPSSLTTVKKQEWLNNNFFYGKDGRPLTLDGKSGANTQFALDEYAKVAGQERMKSYTITTDPGTYYLTHPLNKLGAAMLKPGQYINSHAVGFHQQKQDHEALVQVGNVTVYRDNDLDNVAEATKTLDTNNNFGINIHGSNRNGVTTTIGKWSAGCQVFCEWAKKEEFLAICKLFKKELNNRYTYTLLDEKDCL